MINFDIYIGQSSKDVRVKADDIDITHGLRGIRVTSEAGSLTQIELKATAPGPNTAINLSGLFLRAPAAEAERQFIMDLMTLFERAPEDATVTCEMEHVMRADVSGGSTPTGEQLFVVRVRPNGVVPTATVDEMRTQRDGLLAALRWLMDWCVQRHDRADVEPYEACIMAIAVVRDEGVTPVSAVEQVNAQKEAAIASGIIAPLSR